jgi:hypothetical protein
MKMGRRLCDVGEASSLCFFPRGQSETLRLPLAMPRRIAQECVPYYRRPLHKIPLHFLQANCYTRDNRACKAAEMRV